MGSMLFRNVAHGRSRSIVGAVSVQWLYKSSPARLRKPPVDRDGGTLAAVQPKVCRRAAENELQLAATEEQVVVGDPVASIGLVIEGGALDVLRAGKGAGKVLPKPSCRRSLALPCLRSGRRKALGGEAGDFARDLRRHLVRRQHRRRPRCIDEPATVNIPEAVKMRGAPSFLADSAFKHAHKGWPIVCTIR